VGGWDEGLKTRERERGWGVGLKTRERGGWGVGLRTREGDGHKSKSRWGDRILKQVILVKRKLEKSCKERTALY
jgi:hypothetical protein